MVRSEQKDAIQDALVHAIEASDARAFRVAPTTLAWVPNLEGSRYFLVLKLTRPRDDDLNKLLAACNACARAWSMDLLYAVATSDEGVNAASQTQDCDQDRSSAFHISVAWTLEKPSAAQRGKSQGKPAIDYRQSALISLVSISRLVTS